MGEGAHAEVVGNWFSSLIGRVAVCFIVGSFVAGFGAYYAAVHSANQEAALLSDRVAEGVSRGLSDIVYITQEVKAFAAQPCQEACVNLWRGMQKGQIVRDLGFFSGQKIACGVPVLPGTNVAACVTPANSKLEPGVECTTPVSVRFNKLNFLEVFSCHTMEGGIVEGGVVAVLDSGLLINRKQIGIDDVYRRSYLEVLSKTVVLGAMGEEAVPQSGMTIRRASRVVHGYDMRVIVTVNITPYIVENFVYAALVVIVFTFSCFLYLSFWDEMRKKRELRRFLRAKADGKIKVLYQPIIDIKDYPNVLCAGVEALARWEESPGKLIPPNEFIPVLESIGATKELTHFVLERVAGDMGQLFVHAGNNAHLSPNFYVSVNVVATDFQDLRILDDSLRIFMNSGVRWGERLVLEWTERVFADRSTWPSIGRVLSILRSDALKIRIALDDLGSPNSTGDHTTLLGTFPFDIVKIDKIHIDQIPRPAAADQSVPFLIDAALKYGRANNKSIVAEGVETKGQVEFLAREGCPYIQGHYFSEAMPAEEFMRRVVFGTIANPRVL